MTTATNRIAQRLSHLRDKADGLVVRATTNARMALDRPRKGAITAEYVIVLVAATGFAAVLVALLKSASVKSQLSSIITKALKAAG
jgi:hypothetical protein